MSIVLYLKYTSQQNSKDKNIPLHITKKNCQKQDKIITFMTKIIFIYQNIRTILIIL